MRAIPIISNTNINRKSNNNTELFNLQSIIFSIWPSAFWAILLAVVNVAAVVVVVIVIDVDVDGSH